MEVAHREYLKVQETLENFNTNLNWINLYLAIENLRYKVDLVGKQDLSGDIVPIQIPQDTRNIKEINERKKDKVKKRDEKYKYWQQDNEDSYDI